MYIPVKECFEFCKQLDVEDGKEERPEVTFCVGSEVWVQSLETLSLGLPSLLLRRTSFWKIRFNS